MELGKESVLVASTQRSNYVVVPYHLLYRITLHYDTLLETFE